MAWAAGSVTGIRSPGGGFSNAERLSSMPMKGAGALGFPLAELDRKRE